MFAVEIYAAVRRFVFVEGKSRREAARVFGLSRDTIAKMCRYSAPPGYVRSKAPERPKLGLLVPVIDAILEADKTAPPKQRHTAKRIFERLRLEQGYAGGYTVVKDYVRIARSRSREVFVPLAHPPGHAQVDFGECIGVIGGVGMKLHVFCFDLPHSDACFIKAYPAETTEAFLDGHISAFAFFGGVPLSILYDNLKIAVARIFGDGKRQCTRAFTEFVSHYLFQQRFGRPGKGNDKIPWGLPPAMLPVLARSAIEELIMEANVCNREPSLSNSVEEAAIFVSIELSRARWLVTSLSPNTNKYSRHSVPGSDIAELLRLLGELRAKAERRINAGVRIICIQEIGFDGFWIHRVLESNGIESHVVESASIAVSRRHRRAKTDAIDGELLLRTLMAFKRGEPRVCAMVVVPTPEDEDRRRLSRERKTMVKERIEHINRIKGLMASQGIVGFEPMRSKSRDLLDNLRTGDGRPLPERMKAEITRELKRLELLRKQIAEIEAERDALLRPCETTEPSPGAQLLKLRGIGPEFASVVWQEGLYRQFANRRQLAAYAGLAPSPWQSGDMNKEQGIAKSGNPRLRTTMIEAAWHWLRHQPKSALTLLSLS